VARKNIQTHLTKFHTLGPLVGIGFGFMCLLFLGSLFFSPDLAAKLQLLGLALLGIFTILGLIRTAIMLYQTKNLPD